MTTLEAILICILQGADMDFCRRLPRDYYCVTGQHKYECTGEAFAHDIDDEAERLRLVDNEDY